MSKRYFVVLCILYALPVAAQKGDELLVYAVKGNVVSIYKDKQTPVKVGKVLMPGAVIKTDKGASVTMICSKGKPLSITKEGSFPVNNWKDSCRVNNSSLSGNFLKYIWGQMYVYSPEHKEEMQAKSQLAVVRGDEPPGSGKKDPKLIFSKGMDTVHYDGTDFPLSWTGVNYYKNYLFSLYDSKGKLIYKRSSPYSYIAIDSFRHLISPGKNYKWAVSGKDLPSSKKRLLKYVSSDKADSYTRSLVLPPDVPEDSATSFFRMAYLLEKGHYLARAFELYEKASVLAPDQELYRDQFIRFRNEFWIR